MRKAKIAQIGLFIFFLSLGTIITGVWGGEKGLPFSHKTYYEAKNVFDDPRPFKKEKPRKLSGCPRFGFYLLFIWLKFSRRQAHVNWPTTTSRYNLFQFDLWL